MLSVPDAIATKLPHLPEGPGVYLWKGRDGTTLYVGKAKRLRSRVRSYFNKTGDTRAFVDAVDTLFSLQAHADPSGDTHLGPRAPTPGG